VLPVFEEIQSALSRQESSVQILNVVLCDGCPPSMTPNKIFSCGLGQVAACLCLHNWV
jgi:hypothetical protein